MSASLRLSLLLAALLASSRTALAQGGLRRAPIRPAPGRGVMQQLGLTPLQKRQLNQMRQGRQAVQSLSNQIKESRGALAELYRFYPLDEAQANLLIQRIVDLEGQRLRLQLQNQLDLRRILTPPQFGRFSQLMQSGQRPPLGLPGGAVR